jgi:hypothetical protein
LTTVQVTIDITVTDDTNAPGRTALLDPTIDITAITSGAYIIDFGPYFFHSSAQPFIFSYSLHQGVTKITPLLSWIIESGPTNNIITVSNLTVQVASEQLLRVKATDGIDCSEVDVPLKIRNTAPSLAA